MPQIAPTTIFSITLPAAGQVQGQMPIQSLNTSVTADMMVEAIAKNTGKTLDYPTSDIKSQASEVNQKYQALVTEATQEGDIEKIQGIIQEWNTAKKNIAPEETFETQVIGFLISYLTTLPGVVASPKDGDVIVSGDKLRISMHYDPKNPDTVVMVTSAPEAKFG